MGGFGLALAILVGLAKNSDIGRVGKKMVLRRIPIYFLSTIFHDLKPKLASSKEMAARRQIRYLGLHQRVSGLCARERMRIRRLLLCCGVLLAVSKNEADYELEEVAILVLAVTVVCSMREEMRLERSPRSRVRRTIDQLTDNEAWTNFCFRKVDLPTILTAFTFPEYIPRVASSRFEREGIFLLFLRRTR